MPRLSLLLLFLLAKGVYAQQPAHRNDFLITIAWPRALAKQTDAWYNDVARVLGLNRRGYYRAGHAALILVNAADSSCHYFDFGRYHSPFGTGRVRSATTDHDLALRSKAHIQGRRILNFRELLDEVLKNPSSHASGPMWAGYVRADFQSALAEAERLQAESPTIYGPFVKGGTNCTRFVRSVALKARIPLAHHLRMAVVPMLTPTTLNNVAALWHHVRIPKRENVVLEECKVRRYCPPVLLDTTLPAPPRPITVPEDAQWVAGETGGSWFHLSVEGDGFRLNRFCSEGELECTSLLKPDRSFPALDGSYRIVPMSHCAEVRVLLGEQEMVFRSVWTGRFIKQFR
ncbi:MAG: hypothetical protein K9J06_00380 [Flavobacteriales bacterium]|nr:hypothetical protein [Flavobacteriales bacterium]